MTSEFGAAFGQEVACDICGKEFPSEPDNGSWEGADGQPVRAVFWRRHAVREEAGIPDHWDDAGESAKICPACFERYLRPVLLHTKGLESVPSRSERISRLMKLVEYYAKLARELVGTCAHVLAPRDPESAAAGRSTSAVCEVCGKTFGWWCPSSPTFTCQYSKSEDSCDYCRQPMERK